MSVFSLPTQRCFLPEDRRARESRGFSLPTQRCFYLQLPYLQAQELFSAYAEVFLRHSISRSPHQAFLCLRRGVSMSKGSLILTLVLFSAYAEVFLIPERDR